MKNKDISYFYCLNIKTKLSKLRDKSHATRGIISIDLKINTL